MGWIRTVPDEEASGLLARIYADAHRRAGYVAQIIRSMSLRPTVAEASMGLYQRVMFGRSGLSRIQREILAIVVSRANDCHY